MRTDYEILRDVLDELIWEPSLNATEIRATVYNSVVTLSGTVQYYSEKISAENAVKRVKGVKAVAENIEVRVTKDGTLTDSKIAENVVKAIESNNLVPNDKINIRVDGGWVILEGEVDWLYQKKAATNAISFLNGVREILNWIIIRPMINTAIIKENIRKALERSANLEADNIKIDTIGSKVILKGSARSWNERKEVERAAASAPGVTEVDDQLAVIY